MDMKRHIALVILLIGMLFPFASLINISEPCANIFTVFLNSTISHVIMHSLLFLALSMIVLSMVQNRPLIDRIIFTLLGILIIGILQEMIQAISINSLRLKDTLFDLIIDIMAGAIPLAIIALRKKLNN